MTFDFQDKHYKFLAENTNVSKNIIEKMGTSELDDLYESVLDIELSETPSGSKDMSSRGEIAVEIVNIMAEALGYTQDDDYEEDILHDEKIETGVYQSNKIPTAV